MINGGRSLAGSTRAGGPALTVGWRPRLRARGRPRRAPCDLPRGSCKEPEELPGFQGPGLMGHTQRIGARDGLRFAVGGR